MQTKSLRHTEALKWRLLPLMVRGVSSVRGAARRMRSDPALAE
jgi:hypothetical protein